MLRSLVPMVRSNPRQPLCLHVAQMICCHGFVFLRFLFACSSFCFLELNENNSMFLSNFCVFITLGHWIRMIELHLLIVLVWWIDYCDHIFYLFCLWIRSWLWCFFLWFDFWLRRTNMLFFHSIWFVLTWFSFLRTERRKIIYLSGLMKFCLMRFEG